MANHSSFSTAVTAGSITTGTIVASTSVSVPSLSTSTITSTTLSTSQGITTASISTGAMTAASLTTAGSIQGSNFLERGQYAVPSVLYIDTTSTTVGPSTGYVTLKSFSIPAQFLNQLNSIIRISVYAKHIAGSGSATFRLSYGSGPIILVTMPGAVSSAVAQLSFVMVNIGAGNVRAYMTMMNGSNNGQANGTNTIFDVTVAQTLAIEALFSDTNNDVWVCDFILVESLA